MSQEIKSIYKNMDAYLGTAPKDASASSGLVSKRGAAKDNSSVVNYMKQIRKMRGELNAK
tara:strand:+ start:513 stop:692 length:180 start_codon:yes stop_codon:yes gene_type:complete